jgi:hypothetical protein
VTRVGALEFGFEKAGDFGLGPGYGAGFCFFEMGLVVAEKFNALLFAACTALGDGGMTFGDFGHAVAVSGFVGFDLPAVFVHGFAVFPGENAHEVEQEARGGGRGDGQFECAALDGFEAGLVELDGFAVVKFLELARGFVRCSGNFKKSSESEFLVVAEEFVDGDFDAKLGEDQCLDVGVGLGEKAVVDVFELFGGKVVEFGREGGTGFSFGVEIGRGWGRIGF